jgi:carbon-monoxide dehydrogenase medium subunit
MSMPTDSYSQNLPEMPSPACLIDYVRARDAAEVSNLLLRNGSAARLLMGGTDLFVQMRDGLIAPQMVIDVKHLPGLAAVEFDPDAGLRIGAAVSMNVMAAHPAVITHYPLLVEAASTVASYQLRTRATLGGNLCNASPAADTAPAALILDARCAVWGPGGERVIPVGEFFLACARQRSTGQFLTRVDRRFRRRDGPGATSLGRNANGDLAIVGGRDGVSG